jgi:hypothetical protein
MDVNESQSLWESFIQRQYNLHLNETALDKLIDLCISTYNLDKKSRKPDIVARRTYLIKWHHRILSGNKKAFLKYRTQYSLGSVLFGERSTASFHLKKDVSKDRLFNKYTECIKDFLNS